MKFPSKVTPYKESIIAKFPVILALLEKEDITPSELFSKVKKNRITDVSEFVDVLECLYTLNKIELNGEVIHYVG